MCLLKNKHEWKDISKEVLDGGKKRWKIDVWRIYLKNFLNCSNRARVSYRNNYSIKYCNSDWNCIFDKQKCCKISDTIHVCCNPYYKPVPIPISNY